MSEVRPPFLVHLPAAETRRRRKAGDRTETGRLAARNESAMPCYRVQDDVDDDPDDEDDDEFYDDDEDEGDEDEDDDEPETWQVTP